jgi:hypothetical protein
MDATPSTTFPTFHSVASSVKEAATFGIVQVIHENSHKVQTDYTTVLLVNALRP